MIDLNYLPDPQIQKTQIFRAQSMQSSTLGNWQVWNKPRGITMVNIICIGSGASGAGGNTRAAGGAAIGAGGGGGGSSGYTKLLIPANLLPDQLYISVGVGPLGGIASAAGVIGVNSYVSAIQGSITAANLYLSANANNPAAPAAAGTTGAAGAAGTIASQAAMQLSYSGSWSAVVSIVGGAGSIGSAAAAAVTAMTNSMFCGGTGGGGTPATTNANFAGGQITAAGLIPLIPGGIAAGGNGNPGFFTMKGLCGSGGTGGGSNAAAGTGGVGQDGSIGCGGGGGGQGVTGGIGGRGGNGLVIIYCF